MNCDGPPTEPQPPGLSAEEQETANGPAADENLAPAAGEFADGPRRPRPIVLLSILFEGGLGLVAVLIGWLVGFQPLKMVHVAYGAALWGLAGTVPLLAGLIYIERSRIAPLAELRRLVDQFVVPLFRGLNVWQLAAISLSAGVGEEFLFRGLLQSGLAASLARFMGPIPAAAAALVIASLLFGLVHWISNTYAALCVVIGLYLGAVWLITGNLLVPIVIHATYDWLALIYLLRESPART